MTMPDSLAPLTVVIPTYNRMDVLRRTLAGYVSQTVPDLVHELLVVDDGSMDSTREVVEHAERIAPFRIRYLYQPNHGPAAARNRGIEQVSTPLILFTDDDMIPSHDLVVRHVEWHQKFPESYAAVLGLVKWSAELCPTPFMEWYGNAGPLFSYGKFRGMLEVDFRHFYSCNLSVKIDFLKSVSKFDESFKIAAYEDTELGFRLSKAGLRLLYNPKALAYHYQYFTFAEACRKTRHAASARQRFLQTEAGNHFLRLQHGRESQLVFRIVRRLAAWIFKPATKLLDSHFRLPTIIYRSLFWYYTTQLAEPQDVVEAKKPRSCDSYGQEDWHG